MPLDALAIANYFLGMAESEGMPLTPMKVQKLVYFAHGWHLAVTDQPLINQRVEAWEYGPVIADVYHEFKEFGKSAINRRAARWTFSEDGGLRPQRTDPRVPEDGDHDGTRALLNRVWQVYRGFTAVQLSNLTHLEGTPWTVARRDGVAGRGVIDDASIKGWFQQQAEKNAAKRQAAD